MYLDSINSIDNKNSKIYKKKLLIPKSVEIQIDHDYLYISGKLGKLVYKLHPSVLIKLENFTSIDIYSKNIHINNKALIGTTSALINSMIIGVTLGFVKKLQLVGIGYRAYIDENNSKIINLMIGFSHTVNYVLPEFVKAKCINQTEIILTSANKQLVGQVAANLRAIRPPEPFKGKGIRYFNEIIRIKDTKKR